jgi:hypothetical protein
MVNNIAGTTIPSRIKIKVFENSGANIISKNENRE